MGEDYKKNMYAQEKQHLQFYIIQQKKQQNASTIYTTAFVAMAKFAQHLMEKKNTSQKIQKIFKINKKFAQYKNNIIS